MKKTLNVVLAVILTVAMIASFAYVATPEKSSDYQLSLVSAKVVNVQDTTLGVRSYADLVDTTRIFQVNEVIYLAVTVEVKNMEKYPALKSIDGKEISVIVGSPSIDLSYSKLTSPTMLANVWSGYTAVDVATIGYVAPAGSMIEYDKNANEVKWTFKGVPMYGMTGSNLSEYHLVTFDPKFDLGDKLIEIPAIKLKDKDRKWSLGGQTFEVSYAAPDAIGYTMVITGVTKDNEGAQKGTFYAKLLIKGAEKFESEGEYYAYSSAYYSGLTATEQAKLASGYKVPVDVNGNDALPTADQLWMHILDHGYYADEVLSGAVEYRDYVEVEVDKLELAGGYTIYKYYVPSSAVLDSVRTYYNGEYEGLFNGAGTADWADPATVAGTWSMPVSLGMLNPNFFDQTTSKKGIDVTQNGTGKMVTVATAGGVTSVDAFPDYATYLAGGRKISVPATSVVYLQNAAIYAPGFYGGSVRWGQDSRDPDIRDGTESVRKIEGYDETGSIAQNTDVIDYYLLTLTEAQALVYSARNIRVLWSDEIDNTQNLYGSGSGTGTTQSNNRYGRLTTFPAQIMGVNDAFIDPLFGNFEAVKVGANRYEVKLYPDYAKLDVNNLYPLNKTKLEEDSSLFVWYEDPYDDAPETTHLSLSQIKAMGYQDPALLVPGSSNQFLVPYVDYAGSLTNNMFYLPLTEVTKKADVDRDTYGFSFTNLVNDWGEEITIANFNQVSNIDVGLDITLSNSSTGRSKTITLPIYDLRGRDLEDLAKTSGKDLYGLNQTQVRAAISNITSMNTFTKGSGSTDLVSDGDPDGNWVIAYTGVEFGQDPLTGKTVIKLIDLYVWDKDYPARGWQPFEDFEVLMNAPGGGTIDLPIMDAIAYAIRLFNAGTSNPLTMEAAVMAGFTFLKDEGVDGTGAGYTYDATKAAPVSNFDLVVEHNGQTLYSIMTSDEAPVISIATETTAFSSDDGYGIALFDGISAAYGMQFLASRVYRSNDSNLTYAGTQSYAAESAKKIAALRYFDLDTSFNTVFKVTDATFEAKGAAAVYSEAVEGTFNYGTITIVPDPIDEGTVDDVIDTGEGDGEEVDTGEEIDDGEEIDTGEEVDDGEEVDGGEEIPDDGEEEPAPAPAPPVTRVPSTGDFDANIAIALTAAAIVAAAGLAFVMKKVR